MKLPLFLVALLTASPLFAQLAPPVWPMPTPFPIAPANVNRATYPAPRMEWVERVRMTNAKAQQMAPSIELIFDGDSITDGWQGQQGLPIWNERYGKLNAFDFGIGGDRTEHLLWRLSQGQVNGLHPKLIALMIGTNNLGGSTEEQIADGVKAIVLEYRKRCPNAVILLQGVFPRGEQATDPAREKIATINRIISKLGDGKKVIYVDFGSKFLAADGTLPRDIMPDALHPNAKGYQIWADAIQPIINQYFPQASAPK